MMDSPIRVLQIVTQMNIGGMESRLMELYRHIDRNKVQFDFYTCRLTPGFYDDEINSLGGTVFYTSPLAVKNVLSIPDRFYSFFNIYKNYLIAHCHLNQWCGLVLLGAKKAKIPIRIAHSRTALDSLSIKNLIKNIIKVPVNYSATHKFAVSKKAGEWLFGKKCFSSGDVYIWPNAIDCKKFLFNPRIRDRIRKELNVGNSYVVMHVGNLRPEKNHMFILRIFRELRNKNENCILILIGSDNLNGSIQDEAKRLGIKDGVMFLGSCMNINELLQAADLFLFPSLYEGFPGAVLEAEATGLKCLLSDTITNEVDMCGLIRYESLSDSEEKWATVIQELEKQNFIDRIQCNEIIINKGYDIYKLSKSMEIFYIESLKIKGS